MSKLEIKAVLNGINPNSHVDVDPLQIREIVKNYGGKAEVLKLQAVGEPKSEGEKEWREIFPLFLNLLRWPESPGRFASFGAYQGEKVRASMIFTTLEGRQSFFPMEITPRKIELGENFRLISLAQIKEFEIHFFLEYPERKKGEKYKIGRDIVFRFRKNIVEKILDQEI